MIKTVNINLVPTEIKTKIAIAKQSANIFSICLVVVFLLAVLGGLSLAANAMLLTPNLQLAKDETQKNTIALKAFSDLGAKALFINDRAKMANAIEQKRPYWSQILQDLINDVPQSIQFGSLDVNMANSPNFVLEGFAKTERDIINFKDKLDKSIFFKNVAFKSSATELKPVVTPPAITPAPTTDTTTPAVTPAVVAAPAPIPTETRLRFSLDFDLEQTATNKEKK